MPKFDQSQASFRSARRLAGCLSFVLLGCSGAIESRDDARDRDRNEDAPRAGAGVAGGGGSRGGAGGASACTPNAAPSPLRRLTRAEYNATVADLLGDTTKPADGFVPDDKVGPFDGNTTAPISDLGIEQAWEAAAALSTRAVSSLAALLPCDPKTAGEDACARTFVTQMGARAYRRPLTTPELEGLFARYTTGKAQGGFAGGIRLALHAMLVSPHFLYHVEVSDPGPDARGLARISDFELAARLSYFLWGSMPDAELTKVAAAGELHERDVLAREARRLLDHPRARARIRGFHHDWLGLGDIAVRRELPAALVNAAREDVLETIMDSVGQPNARVTSMLVTDVAFVDKTLAPLYGLSGTFQDTATKVTLAEPERRGVLARVGALLTHGTPSSRGKFVRQDVLCQPVPNPPANVSTELPDPKPGESPRARWERHVTDASCAGCHRLIDPIGFAFDHYDDMGRFRTMNGGFPVDATGELVGVTGAAGKVDGARELQERLVDTEELPHCLAVQWFTFAFGRAPGDADACTVEAARAALAAGGEALPALLLSLATSEVFSMRKVAP